MIKKSSSSLALIGFSSFIIGTDSFLVAGILPRLASDFAVSIGTAGQLVTVYAVSFAILAPLLAAATPKFSKTHLLSAGLVLLAVGNAVAVLTSDFVVALAARCIAGVGAGLFTPNASAAATAITDQAKSHRALATVMLGLSCATALGSPLAVFGTEILGWRLIFALIAVMAATLALFVVSFLPMLEQAPTICLASRIRAVINPHVATTLVSTTLVLTGLYVTYTYCSVVFAEATGGEPKQLAVLLSAWGFAAIVGTLIGRKADSLGDRTVVNFAMAALVIAFATLMLAGTTFVVALVGVVVWGICAWAFVIPQQHRLVSAAPNLTTLLIGLHLTAVYLATSLGALIGAIGLKYVSPLFLTGISASLVLVGWVVSELPLLLRSGKATRAERAPALQHRLDSI
jgi:predicted MFS family arabinose efflux permease